MSTQILWRNGFRNIVAVDPSRVAWDANVVKSLPPGVQFVQASSDRYLASRAKPRTSAAGLPATPLPAASACSPANGPARKGSS